MNIASNKKLKFTRTRRIEIKPMTNTSLRTTNIIYATASIVAIFSALIAASAGAASYIETAKIIHPVAPAISIGAALIAAIAGAVTHTASTILAKHKDKVIAEINSVSAQANNAAAQAKITTEEITKKNLELSIELERERHARLQTQERLGPRKISPTQLLNLQSTMPRFSPNDIYRIMVQTANQDDEVISYARDMAAALCNAGINTFIDTSTTHQITGISNTGTRAIRLSGPNSLEITTAIKLSGLADVVQNDKVYSFPLDYLPPKFNTNELAAIILIFPKTPYLQ